MVRFHKQCIHTILHLLMGTRIIAHYEGRPSRYQVWLGGILRKPWRKPPPAQSFQSNLDCRPSYSGIKTEIFKLPNFNKFIFSKCSFNSFYNLEAYDFESRKKLYSGSCQSSLFCFVLLCTAEVKTQMATQSVMSPNTIGMVIESLSYTIEAESTVSALTIMHPSTLNPSLPLIVPSV